MQGPSEHSGAERRRARRRPQTDGLFETDRPGGLHERVYRSLAHAITSGKFERGVRLPSEPELCSTFGVSRPIVRQALERLRQDGLIESQRGSGNYVTQAQLALGERLPESQRSQLSRRMIEDLEFRLVLEPEAAYLAASRRGAEDIDRMELALHRFEHAHSNGAITHHFDFLFHEAIALATANTHFVEAVRSLEYRPDDTRIPTRELVHFRPPARGLTVLREHGKVFELIRLREPERARMAMREHIDQARTRLFGYLRLADGDSL